MLETELDKQLQRVDKLVKVEFGPEDEWLKEDALTDVVIEDEAREEVEGEVVE